MLPEIENLLFLVPCSAAAFRYLRYIVPKSITGKGRLEAFSDGVLAIIITIMVLELRVPHGNTLSDLRPLLPVGLSYLLSFIYIGIYWNNHHHLLLAAHHVNGPVLWANMHLLFWLSLVPFVTGWMGEHPGARWPVICYGIVLLGAGMAYFLLSRCLIRIHDESSMLSRAIGRDGKGMLSIAIYTLSIAAAFWDTRISLVLYAAVAIIWFIPDRRIERNLSDEEQER